MKKNQKLKLELIRREIITGILHRRADKKLDSETAFGFIERVNDATQEDLNDWVIEAAIHNVPVTEIVVNGILTPF